MFAQDYVDIYTVLTSVYNKSWRMPNVKSPIYPWNRFSKGSGKASFSAHHQLAIRRSHLQKGYTSHYLYVDMIVAVCEDVLVGQ